MGTSSRARALIFGALILGGCALPPIEGTGVRARTTPAALDHHVPSEEALEGRSRRSARSESPLTQACKRGSSKACNELGNRLALKHAEAEARRWYMISCERVLTAMVPTATRLLQLSQYIAQPADGRHDDEGADAANQRRLRELKSEVSEIRASIQGCFDTAETLTVERDPKASLQYYDAACEFSTLVESVGETVPGLEHVAQSSCAGGASARAKLIGEPPFSAQLFVSLTQPQPRVAAVKQSAPQSEANMVFSEGDL